MKKKKLIIGIVLALAVALALWWFVFRKGMDATSPEDQAAYDELYNLLNANIDKAALNGWLGDAAAAYMSGARPMTDTGRLVNGQMTKTGALLSAFAAGYYPYNYYFAIDKNELNRQAYAIFHRLRNQLGGNRL